MTIRALAGVTLLGALAAAPRAAAGPEAPYCEDANVAQERMAAAVQDAMATGQFNNAWVDPLEWQDVMRAVELRLGCRLTRPPSRESIVRQTQAYAAMSPAEAWLVYQSAREDAQAMAALASNIYCPSEVLSALSTHDSAEVRFAVASNPKTPPEALRGFLDDRLLYSALVANPSTPGDVLRVLSQEDGFTKRGVAMNPNTPADVLAELAGDAFFFVKLGVIENKATSREILAALASDPDAGVARAAQLRLRPQSGTP
jgi:hypothetical protein